MCENERTHLRDGLCGAPGDGLLRASAKETRKLRLTGRRLRGEGGGGREFKLEAFARHGDVQPRDGGTRQIQRDTRFAAAANDRRVNLERDLINTFFRQHEVAAIRPRTQHGLAGGRFADAGSRFVRQRQQYPAILEGFCRDLRFEHHAVSFDVAGVFGFGENGLGGRRFVVLRAFQREFVPEIEEFAIRQEHALAAVFEDFFEFIERHIHTAFALTHRQFVVRRNRFLREGGGDT